MAEKDSDPKTAFKIAAWSDGLLLYAN